MQDDKRKINKFVLRSSTELFDAISLELNTRDKMRYYLYTMFDYKRRWATISIEFNKEFSIEYYDGNNKYEFIVINSELEYYLNGKLHDINKLNDLLNSEELKYMIFFNKLYKYLYGTELFNLNVINMYELNKFVGHIENFVGNIKTAKIRNVEMELGKYIEVIIEWQKKRITIGKSIISNYIGIDHEVCDVNNVTFNGSNFVVAKRIAKDIFEVNIKNKEFKVE